MVYVHYDWNNKRLVGNCRKGKISENGLVKEIRRNNSNAFRNNTPFGCSFHRESLQLQTIWD